MFLPCFRYFPVTLAYGLIPVNKLSTLKRLDRMNFTKTVLEEHTFTARVCWVLTACLHTCYRGSKYKYIIIGFRISFPPVDAKILVEEILERHIQILSRFLCFARQKPSGVV